MADMGKQAIFREGIWTNTRAELPPQHGDPTANGSVGRGGGSWQLLARFQSEMNTMTAL